MRACRRRTAVAAAAATFLVATGCHDGRAAVGEQAGVQAAIAGVFRPGPDELPSLMNPEPPFRYPTELYAQRVQGNVTLRLHVDTLGAVVGDSTRVEESSGHPRLDSAAVRGARDLRFKPARRRGTPIAVSLLYPVYFRHPEAAPLPGDTALRPGG